MKDTLFKQIVNEKILVIPLKEEICHASTVLALENGDLQCAWFQGSTEGAPDVKIWGARRSGTSWGTPTILAGHEGIPCWNPVLFMREDGSLVLYYKTGDEIASWQTMYKISKDGGNSWSPSKELVINDHGGRGPVRNKILRLENGRILAPASLEEGLWRSFADISDDDGITWNKSEEVIIQLPEEQKLNEDFKSIPVSEQSFQGRGVIQPTFWESKGLIHMLMRSTEGRIYHSVSKNQGKNWNTAMPTGVPNNNSGIDAAKASDGRVYLVCNPVGESWGKRTPICLFCSEDDGDTWNQVLILDEGEGEFSYPAIICKDNDIYITYTWKRVNIAFWKLELDIYSYNH